MVTTCVPNVRVRGSHPFNTGSRGFRCTNSIFCVCIETWSHERTILVRACVRVWIWSTLQVQYAVGVRPWSVTGRSSRRLETSNYYQGYSKDLSDGAKYLSLTEFYIKIYQNTHEETRSDLRLIERAQYKHWITGIKFLKRLTFKNVTILYKKCGIFQKYFLFFFF